MVGGGGLRRGGDGGRGTHESETATPPPSSPSPSFASWGTSRAVGATPGSSEPSRATRTSVPPRVGTASGRMEEALGGAGTKGGRVCGLRGRRALFCPPFIMHRAQAGERTVVGKGGRFPRKVATVERQAHHRGQKVGQALPLGHQAPRRLQSLGVVLHLRRGQLSPRLGQSGGRLPGPSVPQRRDGALHHPWFDQRPAHLARLRVVAGEADGDAVRRIRPAAAEAQGCAPAARACRRLQRAYSCDPERQHRTRRTRHTRNLLPRQTCHALYAGGGAAASGHSEGGGWGGRGEAYLRGEQVRSAALVAQVGPVTAKGPQLPRPCVQGSETQRARSEFPSPLCPSPPGHSRVTTAE